MGTTTPLGDPNPKYQHDDEYYELLARAIKVCAQYKPRFGHSRSGGGLTLDQFRQMYGADPFYSWLGLDSPMMYAAHKAAGGVTSIYRQVGIGGQWVFNRVLQNTLGLTHEQANWTYTVPKPGEGTRSLSLDGRIKLGDITNTAVGNRVKAWMEDGLRRVLVDPTATNAPRNGAVFEIRQGYKSKDSKRQNADIANAAHAYVEGYLPVVVLLSNQIDEGVATRYTQARWLMLAGTTGGNNVESTYTFCSEILEYDLAGFFRRNSPRFKIELETVLTALLEPDGD